MRRKGIVVAMLLAGLLALPAATQEKPGAVARVYTMKIKPGMGKQFEEGRKRHVDWHRKQKDSWRWSASQVVTGERTGQYIFGTFDHAWKDFDLPSDFAAADGADAGVNMDPYVESESNGFYLYLPDISLPIEGEARYYQLASLRLNMGTEEEFIYVMGKIREAIAKTKWLPAYEVYALVNGGEHPNFVIVLPRANWAAFEPPAKTFEKMFEDAYGREEADALLRRFYHAVRSERTEIVENRPDLAYQPAPAK